MWFQIPSGMTTMRNIINSFMLISRDSEEAELSGTSGMGCEECIVFTREKAAEKAIFSGNYISLKTFRVLVTQRWRIFWVNNEEFIRREFANWSEASIGHSWKGSGDNVTTGRQWGLKKGLRETRRPQENKLCSIFSAKNRVLEAKVELFLLIKEDESGST